MRIKTRWAQVLACAGLTAFCAVGSAHELQCEKTVNGTDIFTITSYPVTLHYELTIMNASGSGPSVVLTAVDPLLAGFGFTFMPPPPIMLAVGESVMDGFDLVINSFEQCQQIANEAGNPGGLEFDNVFTVTSDTDEAQCMARVVCQQTPPPPVGGATRTIGFWKTHETALQDCLNDGPIDLGFITITTLSEALGILWGSPAKFMNGTARTGLDKDRFLLARQTLGGICNQREFGTTPTPPDLLTQAVAALAGTDCDSILMLEALVDAFNGSGDNIAFPAGFVPGPATPKAAQMLASDPTSPSGMMCTP